MPPAKPPRRPSETLLGSDFTGEPDVTDIATSLQPAPWASGELDPLAAEHAPYQEGIESDTHRGADLNTVVPIEGDLDQSGETVLKPLPVPALPAADEYGFADTLIRHAPGPQDPTQLDGSGPLAPLTSSFGPRYRGRRVLGTTPTGTAFEAEEVETGRRVRVEVLLKRAPAPSLSAIEEARRLALAASALRHPGIIEVLDVDHGEERTGPIVVSEWFEGAPLRARLSAGAMSAEEVCVLGATLAETLAAAHAAGVVHGALSVDVVWGVAAADPNVRLVRLYGFGLARLERATGSLDQVADVRALGSLLLEALGATVAPELLRVLLHVASPGAAVGLGELRAALLGFLNAPPSGSATAPASASAPLFGQTAIPLLAAFLAALALAFGATRLYLAYQHQQTVQRIEALSQPPPK